MLAVQALAFIAEDDSRLSGFIASTGIAVQSIRDATRDPNHHGDTDRGAPTVLDLLAAQIALDRLTSATGEQDHAP